MDPIKNRYEFVILFDVENGNPNGDPDAGNQPRVDIETGYGLVTDVCIKRKIRNYVDTVKEDQDGFQIYVKERASLSARDKMAYSALNIDEKNIKTSKRNDLNIDEQVRNFMCKSYYDIRTFGAVMTTFVKASLNCGQIRGPVQMSFAKSIDPIMFQEVKITRKAITSENEAQKKMTVFGQKLIVPYALYRMEGFVSANLARKSTGFSEYDLELLWESIQNMFEHDRSASRGKMAVRELIIFRHESELGNAPAHKLFELVKVHRNNETIPARNFADYIVKVDKPLYNGITLICKY
jgi:CRISPR-associated protein Csd2